MGFISCLGGLGLQSYIDLPGSKPLYLDKAYFWADMYKLALLVICMLSTQQACKVDLNFLITCGAKVTWCVQYFGQNHPQSEANIRT